MTITTDSPSVTKPPLVYAARCECIFYMEQQEVLDELNALRNKVKLLTLLEQLEIHEEVLSFLHTMEGDGPLEMLQHWAAAFDTALHRKGC